jgi:hypothetical protein
MVIILQVLKMLYLKMLILYIDRYSPIPVNCLNSFTNDSSVLVTIDTTYEYMKLDFCCVF